jgi:hypothetical protein
MKKLVLTAVASLACLAAFAQGKVSFQNDSLHLVYWGSGSSLTGSAVNTDNMDPLAAAKGGLSVDLYMGTSSSTLFLYSSTTFGPVANGAGKWTGASVQALANAGGAPAINGGTSVFVEVQIRDGSGSAPSIFTGLPDAFTAYGKSPMFSFTLGGSVTYPVLWSQTVGTWPLGAWPMDNIAPGARGSLAVNIVPEPTTAALAGLGAAALLIFRRRK